MKRPVVIRRVGNSLTLPISDIARDLGLGEGDSVFIVRTPSGFEVTPYGGSFDRAVDAARSFMHKHPNAMKKLAE